MQNTNSRIPLMMTALLLGTLMVWVPPVAADQSPDSDLQAQAINALFDEESESTTVFWYNIDTTNFPLMQQMQQTNYLVYRHSGPLNASIIEENQLAPWANVSACPVNEIIGDCPGMSFQATYALPAGTNGTYYYAITSLFLNNQTVVANFEHGESNVSEGISEYTHDITAPFFVQAAYDPALSVTDVTWVNLNTIVPDSLPTQGDNAYYVKVYRHDEQATRENWGMLNKDLLTMMNATDDNNQVVTGYTYTVPAESDVEMYYSVTYEHLGYEDRRFLGTNTLDRAVHEDNVAPAAVIDVEAFFQAEPGGGTGNTTIAWTDIIGEDDETYHLWRSGSPINLTTAPGVELIGSIGEGYEVFRHEIERGMLGQTFYAVTSSDVNGNHNDSVGPSAALGAGEGVDEDTFTPWIAEPTNVHAVYDGGAETTVTWTDQLGVEGETYHIWRSDVRLTSLSNLELVAELIAVVPDSVEIATIPVEDNVDEPAYYCVSSLARYTHSSEPYEDLRFQQNCWGPIAEDTLRPSLPFLQSATMTDQAGVKITLLRWVNDITESDETYQIWAHHGDPFGGNESVMSGDVMEDAGWQTVLDPVTATDNMIPDFTRAIPLELGLDQVTWYAVTTTDQYGNSNTQFSKAMNARSVVEDTQPAIISVQVLNNEGEEVESLRSGQYTLKIVSNEALAEYPIINLTTTNYVVDQFGIIQSGHAFTDQTSTVRATPVSNADFTYTFDFEVTDTLDTSEIRAIITIRDESQNIGLTDIVGWSIDAQLPNIVVYAPNSQSLYLYGELIHVYGAVTDDVGIASVEIKFQYYDKGWTYQTEWTNMTDLTPESSDGQTLVFEWWEPAATFHDVGQNQRVYIRVTDTSGNQDEFETSFTVDNCVRTVLDFDTACAGQSGIEPPVPPPEPEESFYEGLYLMVYALAIVNFVLLLLAMISLVIGGESKKKKKGDDDDEDDDDWMMEFMSDGGDDNEDTAKSPEDVRKEMDTASEGATERADADDPFAASEGRDRKRRTKKDPAEKEADQDEAEDSDGDDDDFDDEDDDDWDDEDDDDPAPKKKAVKRKKATKRKAIKRKK